MKGVILCLLIARTCTGEYFNLTIKEFEGRFNKAYNTLGEEEAAAINLATQEAQINVQNKKFDNGESNFEGELHPWDDLTEEEFLHQYTGLIEEEEDRDLERANNLRSINHLSRLKKKYSQLEIPEFWDSRDPALTNSPSGWISSVKYQGQCGSCVAFATQGAAEATLIKAGADYGSVNLSEQWLLDCSKGNKQCMGTGTPRYGVFLRQQGGLMMHENDYPYTKGENEKKCPSGPYWSPGYKINDFFFITDNNHSNSPELNTDESMMMRIMEYGSILMAVVAGKGFGSFKSGVYDIENNGSLNHAVLGVGWGTLNGVDYWLIKNSWGPNWGDNGYVKVKRGLIKANYQVGVFTAVKECTTDSVDCTTTQAPITPTPTTTSPPCEDIRETSICIKNKEDGLCKQNKLKKKCKKTCEEC